MKPSHQTLELEFVPLARDVSFFCIGLFQIIHFTQDGSLDALESLVLIIFFLLYLLAMKLLTPYYEHKDTEHHFLYPQKSDLKNTYHYGAINIEYKCEEEKVLEFNRREENNERKENNESKVYSRLGYLIRFILPPFHVDDGNIKKYFFWILLFSVIYISCLSEICLLLAQEISVLLGISHHFTGLLIIALGAQSKSK